VTKRLEGQPTQAIVDYAAANRIDCIVMGTHGRDGLERFFLGSTAEGVLRSGSLPTYLIRASDPSPASRAMPLSRLLVALDHSEPGGAAVAAAIELAIAEHGCIHFCHVLDTRHELNSAFTAGYDPTRIIDQMRVEATLLVDAAISKAHALGIVADGAIVEGEPAAKIIAAVEEFSADIVVLGTHGRTGLQRFFIGSVAETVIRHAPAPALVIRAKRPLPIEVPATRLVERAL
jgi:nucleotide-binding universal stress UspA family protein